MSSDLGVVSPVTRYERGIKTFSLLFTRWMDLNNWSHPVLVGLARKALDDVSWLHSSQISGLRHGKLLSPGPRTFIAIQVLNKALWEYKHHSKLIRNTDSSNGYQDPFVIEENGEPPSLGWFMEVFTGERTPSDIDLDLAQFTEQQAEQISKQYGALIRKLMVMSDFDPITDLSKVIYHHYPARDSDRVRQIEDVLWNRAIWAPDQLTNELPALTELSRALSGPSTEDELLSKLRS